ncbi:hypothetical protein ACP70R_034049 [Stipagrostis hirtigluma subsp. patula]
MAEVIFLDQNDDVSIGASRVKNECQSFRNSCGYENAEGCTRSFLKVKREHAVLRQKLESYFQLLRQAGPAGSLGRQPGLDHVNNWLLAFRAVPSVLDCLKLSANTGQE